MFSILEKHDIDYPGMNISFVPYGEGYISCVRQIHGRPAGAPMYPEVFNQTHILSLDTEFHIQDHYRLNEDVDWGRQKHVSFCTGVEDARFISSTQMICVAHGTNPHWVTKTAYFEFSHEDRKITRFVPLCIEGKERDTEKNWLFLRQVDATHLHFLHWYNPFQIVEVDLDTGVGRIIRSYTKPGLELNCHGGAALFLEDRQQYLVNLRNIVNHRYTNNMWVLFDAEYEICGMSAGFHFGQEEAPGYQISMALHVKEGRLYASVCTDEKKMAIFVMDLEEVLSTIQPIV